MLGAKVVEHVDSSTPMGKVESGPHVENLEEQDSPHANMLQYKEIGRAYI